MHDSNTFLRRYDGIDLNCNLTSDGDCDLVNLIEYIFYNPIFVTTLTIDYSKEIKYAQNK